MRAQARLPTRGWLGSGRCAANTHEVNVRGHGAHVTPGTPQGCTRLADGQPVCGLAAALYSPEAVSTLSQKRFSVGTERAADTMNL